MVGATVYAVGSRMEVVEDGSSASTTGLSHGIPGMRSIRFVFDKFRKHGKETRVDTRRDRPEAEIEERSS